MTSETKTGSTVTSPLLITVLMPVYNGERFIRQAIESILNQTYPHFEFVIVNDGSTDGSATILDEYAARDPRVRPIHQGNMDQPAALNQGIRAARHDWIAIIDHDDISLPRRLEREVGAVLANPTVRAIGTWAHEVDERGRIMGDITIGPTSVDEFRHLRSTNEWVTFVHASVMFHRETVLALGGYRPPFGSAADSDLWSRIADEHDLLTIPEVLVHYRVHLNSMSYTRFFEQTEVVRWIRACTDARRAGRPEPTREELRESAGGRLRLRQLRVVRQDLLSMLLRRRRIARWEDRSGYAAAMFILASLLDPVRSSRRIYERVTGKRPPHRTSHPSNAA